MEIGVIQSGQSPAGAIASPGRVQQAIQMEALKQAVESQQATADMLAQQGIGQNIDIYA